MAAELTHETVDGILMITAVGDAEPETFRALTDLAKDFLDSGGEKLLFDRLLFRTPFESNDVSGIAKLVADIAVGRPHKIAVLAPADDVTHKVGLAMAHSEGVRIVAFVSKSEALKWLQED